METKLLKSGLHALDLDPLTYIAPFEKYLALLQKWNRIYNLTALSNSEEIIVKHFFDSLMIKPHLKGQTILDVGTGAGFPGIPLALVEPQKQFTLLDSQIKKIHFLTTVKETLQLSNITILHRRIEDFSPPPFFSSIVSRAFASLKEIQEKTHHLLEENGVLIVMKGQYPQEELNMLSKQNIQVYALKVPYLPHQRHVVCILKERG